MFLPWYLPKGTIRADFSGRRHKLTGHVGRTDCVQEKNKLAQIGQRQLRAGAESSARSWECFHG